MKIINLVMLLLVAMFALYGCGEPDMVPDVPNNIEEQDTGEEITDETVEDEFNDVLVEKNDEVELGELI